MGIIYAKFAMLERRQAELIQRVSVLEGENKDLRVRLERQEQEMRAANIEIVGMPATPSEDIMDVLLMLAKAIGVPFSAQDISKARRLTLFSVRHEHAPIIVKFASKSVKAMWMSAARHKNIDSTMVNPLVTLSQIYINHHLTPYNKRLLGRAKGMKKENKLAYAGFYKGRVFVAHRDGDERVEVLKQEDLDEFEDNTE